MRVCAACGKQNPVAAAFCMACGAQLVATPNGPERRKLVTALFCDIVGSTAITAGADPEMTRSAMGRYFDEVAAIVQRHGGVVEKFIGDAVMAVFGVPEMHDDDAIRSVRAAVVIRDRLAGFGTEMGIELVSRIGVATGEVVAGDIQARDRLVTGDAVNLAARLQQAAQPAEVLISKLTHQLVADSVQAESIEPLMLKGLTAPIVAFRLHQVASDALRRRERLVSPMVGREADLQHLRAAFRRIVDRRACERITILGAAGVGKSRLIREFLAELGDSATSLRGRCLPYGEGITFWPVREVVRQAAGIEEHDRAGEASTKLDRVLSPLGGESAAVREPLLDVAGAGGAPAEVHETFLAVRRLLELSATERPLVVGIDDVQWAEPTFLDLVEYLVDRVRSVPLMLVCMARLEFGDLRPDWVAGEGVLSLEALTGEASRELIGNLIGVARVPKQLVERLLSTTEGNPLFVEEMVLSLQDRGLLQGDRDWHAIGDEALEIEVPASVQAVLATRLDALPEDERSIAQRAAVVGRFFWWDAVSALGPEDERGRVGHCLAALARRGLIRPDPDVLSVPDSFRFTHLLVRDAAYGSMPKFARAAAHERFADWVLEGTAALSVPEELIGYHLERAHAYVVELGASGTRVGELARRAAEQLSVAGRRASLRGDIDGALGLLSRATALLPPEDEERLVLLPDLAIAYRNAGDKQRASMVLHEAIGLVPADRPVRWHAEVELADLRGGAAEASPDELEAVGREAISFFTRTGDDLGLARAWFVVAEANNIRMSKGRQQDAAKRALDFAKRAGASREQANGLSDWMDCLISGATPLPEVVSEIGGCLHEFETRPRVMVPIRSSLALCSALQGRFDEARKEFDRSVSLAEDLGLKDMRESSEWIRGTIERWAGNLSEAETALRRAYVQLQGVSDLGYLASLGPWLAEVLIRGNRFNEALNLIEESEHLAPQYDVHAQFSWRIARALALSKTGRHSEGIGLAREAVRMVERTDDLLLTGEGLSILGEVQALADERAQARTILERALTLYERKGATALIGRTEVQLVSLA
jgi:class 3 adenylate cyclase/tetratricopeptide (TPR) repeat protein